VGDATDGFNPRVMRSSSSGGGGGNNKPHSNSYQWTETKSYSRQGNATEHWQTHKHEFPEHNMTTYIREANEHINNSNTIKGIEQRRPDTGVVFIPETEAFVFYRLSDNLPRSYHKFDPKKHPGMTAADLFEIITGIKI